MARVDNTGALLIQAGNSFSRSVNNARSQKLAQDREDRVAQFQEQNAAFERERFAQKQKNDESQRKVQVANAISDAIKGGQFELAQFLSDAEVRRGGGDPKGSNFSAIIKVAKSKDENMRQITADIIRSSGTMEGSLTDNLGALTNDPMTALKIREKLQAQNTPSVGLPGGAQGTPRAAAGLAQQGGGIVPAKASPASGVGRDQRIATLRRKVQVKVATEDEKAELQSLLEGRAGGASTEAGAQQAGVPTKSQLGKRIWSR